MRLITAVCAIALVSLALAGCGGGDPFTVNSAAGPLSTPASAPATVTISGTPLAGATAGSNYSFTPAASDSDGGTLTFSIRNAPAWASFNTATGQLSGSPKATDTGSTLNIVITAADGSVKASLAPFTVTVTATPAAPAPTTGIATVSWVAPTQNTNGTALTDLAGFNIYYGPSSSSLTQKIQVPNAGATHYVVTGLATGTWYFAVTSVATDGAESAYSTVSSKTIT